MILRGFQIVILVVSTFVSSIILVIPVVIMAGVAEAEDPGAAVTGTAIIGIPCVLTALVLAGVLWDVRRLKARSLVVSSMALNCTLAVGLVYVAGKAWYDGLHAYALIFGLGAVFAFGAVATLVIPFQEATTR